MPNSNSGLPTLLVVPGQITSPLYVPKPTVETQWPAKPQSANTLLLTPAAAPSPFPGNTFLVQRYAEPPGWIGAPQDKPTFLGGQVPTKLWRWDNIPPSDWVGTPIDKPLFLGGQVPTKRWSYDRAEDFFWNGRSVPAPQFLGGQVSTKLWQWDHVPSAGWTGQSVPPPEFLGGQVPTKLWRYDYAQAAEWIGHASPAPQFLGGQVRARLWRWDVAESTPWSGPPAQPYGQFHPIATTAPFLGSTIDFLTYAETSAWVGAPHAKYPNLTVVVAAQAKASVWRFDVAEQTLWVGRPTAPPQFLGGKVITKLWRWDFVEQPVWVGQAVARPAFLGGQVLTKLWRYDYAEQSVWVGSPLSKFELLGGQVPTKEWRAERDESTAWQGQSRPLPMALIGARPSVQRLAWDFGGEAPKEWQWLPSSAALTQQATPASPFAPRFWSFGIDYAAFWQGRPTPGQPNRPSRPRFRHDLVGASVARRTVDAESRQTVASGSPTREVDGENRQIVVGGVSTRDVPGDSRR